MEVSIVMPCLNEARTVGRCVTKALETLETSRIAGEVIVADNGSTDGSREIAAEGGARVIHVPQRGYGSALRGGIEAARGRYIVMGDADGSYDFAEIPRFVEPLRAGQELVMGNRFLGGIQKGAMPALHRYLGTPVITALSRLFFRAPVGDVNCGFRGFSKEAIDRLALRSTGMEFASEMVVKATLHRLRVTEVPASLSPAGRDRPPHLRTWRDGGRHVRFLLESFLEVVHGRYIFSRRVRVLSGQLARLIPPAARVLDVGCGSGAIARRLQALRPDVTIEGIDVPVRPRTAVPVLPFDGAKIPRADKSFDAVLLVDVLHHTRDPVQLLREAARVARTAVILKDHLLEGSFAHGTLRVMDWVGNERYGVPLPYNYWPRAKWEAAFRELGLRVQTWTTSLHLYPPPATWIFDRSLHFIASVAP